MDEYRTLRRIGVENARSYYIPFAPSDKPTEIFGITDRNSSSRFMSLDDEEWLIGQTDNPDVRNVDEPLTQTINVPSCVQLNGFDQIQYLNLRYPFPFDPPYVPHKNPCWHYRCEFTLFKEYNYSYYLNFEGVDSAFYVYVNGRIKGFSQISHATSEFDITTLLYHGRNTIDVFVLKWCASSYLECQDKFRFSGIFRSVYILGRPKRHITDYKIETSFDGDDGVFVFRNESNIDIKIELDGQSELCPLKSSATLRIPDVKKWTAETPYLYDCVLSVPDEVIYEKVGFVSSKIIDGIFTINGVPTKLKGVNRHEFNPETGATISLADVERDLRLIKSLNCNAIRTSHYPNIPAFYQMCDAIGLYVMDEADLETHGASVSEGDYSLEAWQNFADDEFWTDGIFDRHRTLVERDKNRCSVVMWSLGNESSFGKAFLKGARYIKKRDSRPVHYEGLRHAPRWFFSTRLVDVASVMYPPYNYVAEKFLDHAIEKRPLVFCEYSHAMGNSNGDLGYYWKLIYSEPRLIGGFVWEWADHAVKGDQGFLYGGDFGEAQHDSNFCVDGLVTADRELKPGAFEMQAVYGGKTEPDSFEPLPVTLANYGKKIQISTNSDNGEIDILDDSGKRLTAEPIRVNIMRACTDNDSYGTAKAQWSKWGVDRSTFEVRSAGYEGGILVFRGSMQANSLKPLADIVLGLRYDGNELEIELSYSIRPYVPSLPRVGLTFAIDDKYNKFVYHGFGENESYVDKCLSSTYGRFQSTAEESVAPYVRPQETGSHCNSTYLNIVDFAEVTADKCFSFSVLPYSVGQLASCKHNFELRRNGKVYVSLDVAMRGVGSNSCGPTLLPQYEIPRSGSCKFKLTF